MIKLIPLIKEIHQDQLDEGWKENILAMTMAAASIFGNVNAQTPKSNQPSTTQQVNTPSSLNVNLGSVFPSGKYIISGQNKNQLIEKLSELGEYVTKNPNSDYKIEIISSESQVPNYDGEQPSKPKLAVGELAKKRAEVANYAVNTFINDLKKKNKIFGNILIEISPILIGKEKFTQGKDNKDDQKYTKDQFVIVKITAINNPVTSNYSAYATDGEEMYMGSRIVAMMFKPVRKTADITKSGNLDNKQTVLLRMVRTNTPLSGDINQKGVYIRDYKIPSDEWYKVVGTTHTLTPEMIQNWDKYKVN